MTAPDRTPLDMNAHERSLQPGYDRHGNPNDRYLPGHPWAHADDVAGRVRDALGMTITGATLADIETETGLSEKAQQRCIRKPFGLRQELRSDAQLLAAGDLGTRGAGSADRLVLTEVWPGALDAATAVHATVDAADDVVLAALRAGLVAPRGTAAPIGVPRISRDHPAVTVWQQEQALPAATGQAA